VTDFFFWGAFFDFIFVSAKTTQNRTNKNIMDFFFLQQELRSSFIPFFSFLRVNGLGFSIASSERD
jgi:hypothetical protein